MVLSRLKYFRKSVDFEITLWYDTGAIKNIRNLGGLTHVNFHGKEERG